MQIYIQRPTRGREFYSISDRASYKSAKVEIPDEDLEHISNVMLNFHNIQAMLADMYSNTNKGIDE